MGKSQAAEEMARIIKTYGGIRERRNKHEFWRFPGGQTFTRSCTPSDCHAEDNALRDLKRILDLNGVRGIEGERRVYRERTRSQQPTGYAPTFSGVLAEKLVLAGVTDNLRREQIDGLRDELFVAYKHIGRLKTQCRLKDKALRSRRRETAGLRRAWGYRLMRWVGGVIPRLLRYSSATRLEFDVDSTPDGGPNV